MNGEELVEDDHHSIHLTTLRMREQGLKFQWLNNNGFFAMHGANESNSWLSELLPHIRAGEWPRAFHSQRGEPMRADERKQPVYDESAHRVQSRRVQ